ncbi:MAG: MauE/DoxX family redox-associated membrane protein [Planctomycetales bacterium]
MQRIRSAYRQVATGPEARVFWLKVVIAGAMASGMLLSPKLWLSDRSYPLTPVSDLLPGIPSPGDRVWFGTLLALLVGVALLPRPRTLIVLFVLLAGLLSLWDQSRWQPWFYQYLLMLVPFVFYSWTRSDAADRRRKDLLGACRVIVAATYIWSGLQKFNVSFTTNVYPWLIEPFLPESARSLAESGGLVIPVMETAIGLGLLVPSLRPVAAFGAVAMHAAILLCLGPLGHDWNSVVWPWNVAMPLFAAILFGRTPGVSFREVTWPGRGVRHWAALALVGILPGLSFADRWDAYLSAALYSGNTLQADLVLSDEAQARLPDAVRQYSDPWGHNRYRVSLADWSVGELNVPPYPARRVFRNIARSVGRWAEEPGDVVLVIRERPDWLSGDRETSEEDAWDLDDGRPASPAE